MVHSGRGAPKSVIFEAQCAQHAAGRSKHAHWKHGYLETPLRSHPTCRLSPQKVVRAPFVPKAADVWKTDVWDFQAFSQTFLRLRFFLGNKGKDSKNLNSQTWPGTPRRPSPRHPRPSDLWHFLKGSLLQNGFCASFSDLEAQSCSPKNTPKNAPKSASKKLRSRPGKPTKERAKTKSSYEFRPFLCEFGCLPLGKQARFTYRTLFRSAPAKSSRTDLSLIWFAGATPEKRADKRNVFTESFQQIFVSGRFRGRDF